jgi:phage shock protein PspC (stress-responsive transcriptional regulator)
VSAPERHPTGPGSQASGPETGTQQRAAGSKAADPAADTEPTGAGTAWSLGALRRVQEQKMLGGVCAGLGQHCAMDPVIFRIVLAVLSLTGGLGLIFYGLVWLFVPFEGEQENEARRLLAGRVDGVALTAVLFALVGCGLFLSVLGRKGVLTFGATVALLLAGAGYWSRQRGAPDPDPLAAQAAADAPPEAQAPPVPTSFPSWWRDPIVKDGTHVGGTGYLWGPQDMRDISTARNIARRSRWEDGTSPPRSRAVRGPSWIGGWVFLLALIAGTTATTLTWDTEALGTSLQMGLAAALAVFGVGIGLSALLGRTGAGSIMLAVITAALLATASALPKTITTDWVRTSWHPTTTAQVQPYYELGTGDATLDLSRIKVTEGGTVKSTVEVGAGRLKVLIPKDATIRLHVTVGLGDIQLPGDRRRDVDVAPGKEKKVTVSPSDGRNRGGIVDLELDLAIGQVEVSRAAA